MPYDEQGNELGPGATVGGSAGLSPWEQAHGGHDYDPNSPDNAHNNFDTATEGYYGGHNDNASHDPVNWYDPSTYGWLVNTPGPSAGATPTPGQSPSGGGGGGGGGGSHYTPPGHMASPFITADGHIPPGLPYSPDMHFRALQDDVLNKILTTPTLSPEYINRVNEQQKELILNRQGAGERAALQNLAHRGVLGGGQLDATQRRLGDQSTQQLLQSNRDIFNQAEVTNRQGFLDALTASQDITGAREDRGLNASKFMEMIRQYEADLAERQSEFGAGLNFNYNSLNAQLEEAFRRLLAGGGS